MPPRSFVLPGAPVSVSSLDRLGRTAQEENTLIEELSHESLATVTFADQDGKTMLTTHQVLVDLAQGRGGASEGWTQSLDRRADYLAKA